MAVLKYTLNGSTYTAIPAGPKGDQGVPGNPGAAGAAGQMGATGPVRMYVQPAQPDVQVTPDGFPLWLDTDAVPAMTYEVTHPNGSDVLVKVGGQTVHYDSGVRDITAILVPSNCTINSARVRRIGAMISFEVDFTVTAASNGADAGPFPMGFRPPLGPPYWDDAAIDATSNYHANALVRGQQVGLWSETPTMLPAGSRWRLAKSIQTGDPIPTSLPGTLVSAAPA